MGNFSSIWYGNPRVRFYDVVLYDLNTFSVSPTVRRYTRGGMGGLRRNERVLSTDVDFSVGDFLGCQSPEIAMLMLSGRGQYLIK